MKLMEKLAPQQRDNGFDPREIIAMALGSNDQLLKSKRSSTTPGYTRRTSTPVSTGSVVGAAPSAPVDGNSVQRLAQAMAAARGWSGPEWDALYDLISRESGWNPNADNPTSSAAGLFQKMTNLHGPLEPTLEGQIQWGLDYIANRYGSPSAALSHWQRRVPINGRDVGHWY